MNPFSSLSGGLIVVLAVVAIVIASRIPFLRRAMLFVVNLLPAGILTAIGIVALPFWKVADLLVGRLFATLGLDARISQLLERLGALRARSVQDPVQRLLLEDERRKVAEWLWPANVHPDLYRHVPDDVLLPPYDDGRLIGGMRLHWLADRYMTPAAVRSAVRIGATTALLAFVAAALLYLLFTVYTVYQTFSQLGDGEAMAIERWPNQDPTPVPTWWTFTAALSVIGPTLLRTLGNMGTFLPGTALACVGIGMLTMLLLLGAYMRQKAAPYEWQSKDADVRWAYRSETRRLIRNTYAKQVLQATEYLKDQPVYTIGRGTGTLRARGDLTGPLPDQPLRIDQEALYQHLLVFGGTGEGKTTALLKPLLRQLLRQPNFGFYICDAKGVLWNDVLSIIRRERPNANVITIGTGPDQFGVDVLAGLTPTQVAGTLRSVMTQVSGGDGGDSFWPDMAANVLRNVLSVGYAYAATEAGEAATAKSGVSPYSLWWAYQAVLRPEVINEATGAVREWLNAAPQRAQQCSQKPDEFKDFRCRYDRIGTKEVYDSIQYLEQNWRDMARDTKSGIVANVTRLLDGFAGTPVLRERFACGNPANTISIAEALNGKIVLNALSTIEDGLPARIVSVLLKSNLYREARQREANYRKGLTKVKPQSQPCVVLMDEVQEIVTADPTSGLSDATFWNVARSTGVAGIFATQTAAALYQAIGKEAAFNFMQQARSKVFFRTEDQDTVEYACWCAGKYERNRVYDDGHRESIEFRGLIDGWDPVAPVDEEEGIEGSWRVFFQAAGGLLNPDKFLVRHAEAARAYEVDGSAAAEMDRQEGAAIAQIQSMQAAVWRAEDLERDYRKSGNEVADALTPADLIHMGRWHAYAHIQRAGAVRQDILVVEHDFA